MHQCHRKKAFNTHHNDNHHSIVILQSPQQLHINHPYHAPWYLLKGHQKMNVQEIKGDWSITKSKLKQTWSVLTDDDLRYEEGKQKQLLERIQKRTGEATDVVEQIFKQACDDWRV